MDGDEYVGSGVAVLHAIWELVLLSVAPKRTTRRWTHA